MKSRLIQFAIWSLVAWCLLTLVASAGDPRRAVVRIRSHGASATIVYSDASRSVLLGCAHMFEDMSGKPFKIDGAPQTGVRGRAQVRVIAVDARRDLSLLEMSTGGFNYVPIAPQGHQLSRSCVSCGYDEMRWPVTYKGANILSVEYGSIYTDKIPWHGRSGGGLFDGRTGHLIGVVQGYEVRPGGQRGKGIYVAHDRILAFVSEHLPGLVSGGPIAQRAQPRIPQRLPSVPQQQWSFPGPDCAPGGT